MIAHLSKTRLYCLLFLIVTLRTGGSSQILPPDSARIDEVERGQRRLARAVWWGFNPTDVTQSLRSALFSPADTVQVSNTGAPWNTEQIFIPSNKVLLFDTGVVVSAKPGGMLAVEDNLFRLVGVTNVALVGYGAELRMRREDYIQPPYQQSEWRHILGLYGCRNVKIRGLRLANSGGDGINIENLGDIWDYSDSVHIKDIVADSNYRQGISIIAAKNILIEGSLFIRTGGTPPQDGIDFEPYEASQLLQNIVVRNCRFTGNAFFGIDLFVGVYRQGSPPVSIVIENSVSEGNAVGAFRVFGPETPDPQGPLGFIRLTDCVLSGEVRTRDNWAGSIEVLIEQALPVQLSGFSAEVVRGADVRLRWTTLSEINNYGFYVQRKRPADRDFRTLDGSFTPGHGTSTVPRNYAWTDLDVESGTWQYRLKQLDLDNTAHFSDPLQVILGTMSVDAADKPSRLELYQNYPNPFNPGTVIRYAIPEDGIVTLKVYTLAGQEVATLVNDQKKAGKYEIAFDAKSALGTSLASGLYLYRVKAANFSEVKKMVLLK